MALSQFSLKGKVAVVTGASRGIGRASAIGLAGAGADVVVASRKAADLEQVADDIRQQGRRALVVPAHLAQMDDIKAVVDKTVAEFGRIDILVNNAGTNPAVSPALELDEKLWDTVIGLNLKGLFFLSQAAARVMKAQGGGCIINMASVDAYQPEMNIGIYAISKAGVVMATKVMAQEWAPYHIRVNTLAPGQVHTKLGDSRFLAIPGYEKYLIDKTPMGHIAQPDEVVGSVVYLASTAAAFVTGHTLVVDGGFTIT